MQQPPPERQAVIQNALKNWGNGAALREQIATWTIAELIYAEERVNQDVYSSYRTIVMGDLARARAELLDAERHTASETQNAARHREAMELSRETLTWAKVAGWAAIVGIVLAIIAIVVTVYTNH